MFSIVYWANCVGVPHNSFGFQNAHSGNGYAGLITYRYNSIISREYIMTELALPKY
jgi:hypothetical protein